MAASIDRNVEIKTAMETLNRIREDLERIYRERPRLRQAQWNEIWTEMITTMQNTIGDLQTELESKIRETDELQKRLDILNSQESELGRLTVVLTQILTDLNQSLGSIETTLNIP
jgi:hypothetical protein